MNAVPRMRPDVLAEVLSNLKRDFGFKEHGGYLRQGKCPACGKTEVFIDAKAPWVAKCGRDNKCGWSQSTKELYPDAFGKFNERFPATTQDPNATADAYMSFVRGFDPKRIRGWYRQGHFSHPRGDRSTATVVFDIDRERGIFMERLVETVRIRKADGEIEDRKANFEGTHKGLVWMPPGQTVKQGELWFAEGCLDTIALKLAGLQSAATLSAGNFPAKLLETLDPRKVTLVWALDNDRAGNSYTHKHVRAAKDLGFESRAAIIPQQGKKKTDWNDAHLAGKLEAEDLDLYRHHGDLLLAETALEKGALIWARTKSTWFLVEYRSQTFWFHLDAEKHAKIFTEIAADPRLCQDPRGAEFEATMKAARVEKIANCLIRFLYYMQNKVTDESWYYARIEFPDGRPAIKNTFTSAHLGSASEFDKRLMHVAPGRMYSGSTGQLRWIKGHQLDDVKTVETVDFIGYAKDHRAWVFQEKAVAGGQVFDLNDEDFFEIGRLSIKTLMRSIPLAIGTKSDYDPTWINKVHAAFGARGIIAAAYWLGTLFAEQIRERHQSFPFLEIVGEAGAGKTTLIEFLWKLVGRADYEGIDPNKGTAAGRARALSQLSNLPVVMIEGDRSGDGDTAHAKQFDWDSLKDAFNGRPIRTTGVKNSGNDTYEPPFRASIVISQNAPVTASEAIMTRIVHLFFRCTGHSDAGKDAADALSSMPAEKASWFLLMATSAEAAILDLFNTRAPQYEAQVMAMPEVRKYRIAKCHGQLMAMVDALAMLTRMPEDWRAEAMKTLQDCAAERQKTISGDPPLVEEFWDVVDFIGLDRLNHARDDQYIAINLPHLQQEAERKNQRLPAMRDLKNALRDSRTKPFVALKAVNSGNGDHFNKTIKCWVFSAGKGAANA